ncbi:MAG TPA: ABC transporter permease subunit [Thermomicrobiales bacterium]|nr:ABC transporter permease subunit [Thermomicrobiales bacterium]
MAKGTHTLESAGAAVARPRRAGRPRAFWIGLLLLAPAVILVLALFFYPFFYGLRLSFDPVTGGRFENYRAFFSDARERATIGNTLRLAVPATVINLAVAIPLAYRMRRRFYGRRVITGLFVIPMTLGTVLIAQGMLSFFGRKGWFNKTLELLHLTDEPLRLVHNRTGVIISLTIAEFPVVFLILLGFVSGIDPNLERAAQMLGANGWQRFRRIMLPLMIPGIATAFALSFVATFAVFPSAVMLGQPAGETRVIAIAAWQAAYERFDYSAASAIAIVMAGIEVLVLAIVLLGRSRLYRGPSSGGKG